MVLDPRSKMVLVFCLSSLALLYNTPGKLLILLAATIILLLVFRFNLTAVWGYLTPFLSLMLFLFVMHSIFSPGKTVLLNVGPVSLITAEGLLSGASVVLRIMVVTASAMLLTTFNSRDFILGLVQWRIPYELVFMVSIALRFLPVFRDEFVNVIRAIQLRGVELKKIPWGKKIALYRRLLFPAIYRAMLKGEKLAVVMESRGFRAYPRRTYHRRLYFKNLDYAVIILSLGATALLIVQEII